MASRDPNQRAAGEDPAGKSIAFHLACCGGIPIAVLLIAAVASSAAGRFVLFAIFLGVALSVLGWRLARRRAASCVRRAPLQRERPRTW